MPLYEYRCGECEHHFEALAPAGRADEEPCPECGAAGPRRLLSVFSAPRGASAVARGGDGASAGGCCGGACGHC
jgi:putative FmdB family regulatory protein